MTTSYLTSLLFLFLFITISDARNSLTVIRHTNSAPPKHEDIPHIPVCNHSRFALLGLNMSEFHFCDSSLPFPARAKDLIDRMTLEEKAKQMGSTVDEIPRLGLPKYEWWSEALHGVATTGYGTFFDEVVPGATSFPNVILSAASFNSSLWKTLGQVVSTEARAMHNLGRTGLTFWSPNINVVRDPRWGRVLETPGEDPFLVGTYSANYVRGLQDVEGSNFNSTDLNSRPLKVSACCKHYAAYDLENWLGVDRFHFDAKVTEQDMVETFIRPFEMCVREGDASSLMCSFNQVHGIPTCADTNLLKNTVRGDWDLHGYIVSDCDSIETIKKDQKWLGDTGEDASAQVLKAGLDLDCGHYYPNSLANAVKQGKVKESDMDKSLNYLYVVLMRLGYFDGSPNYEKLGKQDVCSDEHIELAAEAAREGIVLLKNNDQTLPLDSKKVNKIAVIGPLANATKDMIGNYAGIPCRYISPLDGFSNVTNVTYEMGCPVSCENNTFSQATKASATVDATILVVGTNLSIEREGVDRVELVLPGQQAELINQIADSSKGPVILVVICAGPVDISFAKNNPKIKAILWAGFPGQEGGKAIADIVFGKYNPGGRLPLTWYEADYANQLPMTSMSLRPVKKLGYPGRTYKFFDGPTVYPFGYGLSYTKFNYQLVSFTKSIDIKLGKHQLCRKLNYEEEESDSNPEPCPAGVVEELQCSKGQLKLQVSVQNVGDKDGSEVVLIYSKAPKGIVGTPIKQLIGFERVFVKAGETKNVNFEMDPCKSLNIVDESGYNVVPSGTHEIEIGNGILSTDIKVELKKN